VARKSFDEALGEIASLVKTGKEEFGRGNQQVGLLLLLEAQGVFNEWLQNEIEKAHGSSTAVEAHRPNNTRLKAIASSSNGDFVDVSPPTRP
jgi:hypothetical protein